MTVEPRRIGRWKREKSMTAIQTVASAHGLSKAESSSRRVDFNARREPSQEEWMETDDRCLQGATWVDLLSLNLGASAPTSKVRPSTGEPDAGNPPVRFGGRGEVLSLVPTPIKGKGGICRPGAP